MVKHVITVKVAVLWGEHRVGVRLDVIEKCTFSIFIKKGLRNEIIREHYDAARFSTNINPEFSRVPIGWSSRMDVPRKGWDLLKNELIRRNNKLIGKNLYIYRR